MNTMMKNKNYDIDLFMVSQFHRLEQFVLFEYQLIRPFFIHLYLFS